MELYAYRADISHPIVNVYEAHYQNDSAAMCTKDKNIAVMTEYIPYRLSDTKNLNHGQALYILS
jgi:hypothetical protein